MPPNDFPPTPCVLRLGSLPAPIATDPVRGTKIRLSEDGEKCMPLQRLDAGRVLVRLLSDDYLAIVNQGELA